MKGSGNIEEEKKDDCLPLLRRASRGPQLVLPGLGLWRAWMIAKQWQDGGASPAAVREKVIMTKASRTGDVKTNRLTTI